MSDELLPCPFCGGKADLIPEYDSAWRAACLQCDATFVAQDSRPDAIAAWNRRATDRPPPT
jgi:Lar family restriction alleviation protein